MVQLKSFVDISIYFNKTQQKRENSYCGYETILRLAMVIKHALSVYRQMLKILIYIYN